MYALGVRTIEVRDNQIEMVFYNDRTVSVFEKIYKMLQNSGTMRAPTNGVYACNMMQNGRTVFATMNMDQIRGHLREYENAFGVIPLPKWEASQEKYYSTADAGCNIIAVLTTAKNTELIGAVTEAMNAESWRTVMPVFCDVTLGTKMARDEESQEMIELVLNSRYIDFAYLYDGWSGWSFRMADFIATEGVFASTYEKSAKVIKKYYEKVLRFFYE